MDTKKQDHPLKRCFWAKDDELAAYHDAEWGVPIRDDQRLFEALVLGGAQAGLSWSTILKKRENYRLAFDHFNPSLVAKYDQRKLDQLLQNPGIVRNRLKIASAIRNAQAFLKVQAEFGTFAAYLWRFVDGQPKQNAWQSRQDVPAMSAESDALSKDLKRRGFQFVGSTICYATMQAVGMINDHLVSCFRYDEIQSHAGSR